MFVRVLRGKFPLTLYEVRVCTVQVQSIMSGGAADMMSGDDGDGAAEGNHDSDDVMHQVEEVSTRTPTADDICQAAADILDVHYDESIQVADLLDAVELNLDVGQGSLVRWTNHFATLLRERRPVVDTGGLLWRNKTAPAASIPRHRPPANSTWDPYAGAVTDKEGNIVRYNGAWVSKGGSEDGDEGGPSEAMTASAAPKRLGRPRRDNTADKCTDTGPVPAKPPRGPRILERILKKWTNCFRGLLI